MVPRDTVLERSVRDPLPKLRDQLADEFGQGLPVNVIDAVAQEEFHRFDEVKVREFVPVFAWRRARMRLRNVA